MIGFIPFLFILFILIAISFFIAKIFNNRKILINNRVQWIFAGYVVILLISAGIVTLLPVNKMTYEKIDNSEDLSKENEELYYAAVEGRINEVNPALINKQWTFNYSEKTLHIEVEKEGEFYNQIVVEKKETNDQKIEAVFLKSRSVVNDWDVTKLINPIRVRLTGDTLKIINPEFVKIEFSQLGSVFAINQFTGTGWTNNNSSFIDGQSILYLKIPKDLELIEKKYVNLQFVN
ncbi:hypothetical protein [Neobacillus sp. LXY-4]|uniref:hypothetical protein n=1 Tax=Neobacillus sp. LXY-4 TaxID=3379826 RepID=UPI003EE2C5EB